METLVTITPVLIERQKWWHECKIATKSCVSACARARQQTVLYNNKSISLERRLLKAISDIPKGSRGKHWLCNVKYRWVGNVKEERDWNPLNAPCTSGRAWKPHRIFRRVAGATRLCYYCINDNVCASGIRGISELQGCPWWLYLFI